MAHDTGKWQHSDASYRQYKKCQQNVSNIGNIYTYISRTILYWIPHNLNQYLQYILDFPALETLT